MRFTCSVARPVALFVTIVAGGGASAVEKDLRTQNDAKGETEIGFCSRPSPDALFNFPGHAFVTFSDQAATGRKFRSVGHTVAGAGGLVATALTYFGGKPVAGKQAEERYTHMKQACLMVKVDRAAYDKAVAAARPTLTALGLPDALAASAESYSLSANDCVDFVVRVAGALKAAGLKVPERAAIDTPAAYIAKLSAANGT